MNNEEYYVQYGCGWSAPRGWRNFDASLTLRFERLPIIGLLYTNSRVPSSPPFSHGLGMALMVLDPVLGEPI
jgi:hypothetical protein